MSLPIHTFSMHDGGWPAWTDRIISAFYPSTAFSGAAGAVAATGTVTPGTGYTSVNTISVTPTGGVGSGLSVVAASLKVVSAAVATGGGGTGYTTNDTITFANGVVLTVTATAGAITALAVTTAGSATSAPTNPVSPVSTSGTGTGASVNLVWGINQVQILNSGSYTTAPTAFTVADSASVPGTGGAVAAPSLGTTGSSVVVGFTGLSMPPKYMVQVTPSVPAIAAVTYKSQTAFSISLTPLSNALAAGTVDVLLLA